MAESDKITLKHLRMSMEKCKENDNNLQQVINGLDSQIRDIANKNNPNYISCSLPANIFEKISVWNTLGDSITAGMNTTKIYHQYISDQYNITVNNYGISGTEICKGGTHQNPMCERYVNMDDNAELITVFGGVNDFLHNAPIGEFDIRNNATFYGGVRTLIEGLIQKYPYKLIYFFTPLKVRLGTYGITATGTNNLNLTLDSYIQVIKECCNYYSIPCVDLNNISSLNPNYDYIYQNFVPDGLHPNEMGHLKLAKSLTYISLYPSVDNNIIVQEAQAIADTSSNLYDGGLFTVNGKNGYYSSTGVWYENSGIPTAYIPVTKGGIYEITIRNSTDEVNNSISSVYFNFFKNGVWVGQYPDPCLGIYVYKLPENIDYDHIGLASRNVSNWSNLCVYNTFPNLYDGGLFTVNGNTGFYIHTGDWKDSTVAVSTSPISVEVGGTYFITFDSSVISGIYINYRKGDTFIAQDNNNGNPIPLNMLTNYTLRNDIDYDNIIIASNSNDYSSLIVSKK